MSEVITLDQIKEAVGKQPDLKKSILSSFKDDFVKGAEAEGLVVRTKEQDQQHLESQINILLPGKVDEKFSEKFKQNLDTLDVEIKTLTGIEKNTNEKTTDYAKRAFKEFHNKGGDPVTKQKVQELENLISSQKSDWEKKLSDAEKKLFDKEIEWQANNWLDKANIALPVHLKTDEEKNAFINQQKSLMKQGFLSMVTPKKDDQGNVTFYEADKPLLNTKDGKPLAAGDIMQSKFSAWLTPAQHRASGSGTGGNGSTVPANGFTKKEEIHEYLRANGIEVGTQKYLDELSKLATESKIEI